MVCEMTRLGAPDGLDDRVVQVYYTTAVVGWTRALACQPSTPARSWNDLWWLLPDNDLRRGLFVLDLEG